MVRQIDAFIRAFKKPYGRTRLEKARWVKAGKSLIRAIAKHVRATCDYLNYDPVGNMDRGCITAFLNRKWGGKYVYISITDFYLSKLRHYPSPIMYQVTKGVHDWVGGPIKFVELDVKSILRMIEDIDYLLS